MLKSARQRLTSRRRYSKPPITEALIDLQVEMPPSVSLATLQPLRDALMSEFPEVQERVHGQLELNLSPTTDASLKQSRSVDGYLLVNPDRTRALQVRLPAFTFSRLRPYDSWEEFRDSARKY